MRFWGTLCVVIAVVLGALAVPARVARAAESCPDVLVLGSRGSGESAIDNNGVGPAVDAFYTEFQPMVTAAGKTIELWANGKADTPEETAAPPDLPLTGHTRSTCRLSTLPDASHPPQLYGGPVTGLFALVQNRQRMALYGSSTPRPKTVLTVIRYRFHGCGPALGALNGA
jgi:hypothetical protein